MFSQVLDCPFCRKRFNYEQTDKTFPENLTCPECGQTGPYQDFSAIILCHQCRKKVMVPLELLYNDDTLCPHCQTVLKPELPFLDEDASTYTLGGSRHSNAKERILQDGEFFDKYKIIRLLGKGGMAEVYLAEHLLLKKPCALKLMQSSVAAEDPVFTKRFIREAKLTHQLTHPNIVNVFDAGSDFKTRHLFLAMEYVEGKTLSQLSREKKLSEQELTAVLVSMLNALKLLAEAHVVHRDIKPSNIMQDQSGVWKLMDLGIAKSESNHQAGELTLTMEQSVIGTPGYASPEQCRSAHNTDIRSDLYCLGATLYHAASGVIPHDGETPVEIILKVLQEEPEPLKTYRPDLSPKFLEIIEKMMQKNPDDRPADPDAVIDLICSSSSGFAASCKRFLIAASARIDLAAPLAFLFKLLPVIRKAVRTAFILLLLAVIVLAGTYLWQSRKKDISGRESFVQYVQRLTGRKTARIPQKTRQKKHEDDISRFHPLMKYPGEEENQAYREDPDAPGEKRFPVVIREKSSPVIYEEFDSLSPRNRKYHSGICRDGLLDWGKKQPSDRIYQLFMPEFFQAPDITFSADLRFLPGKISGKMRFFGREISFFPDRLRIIWNYTYAVDLPVRIQPDRWFNITLCAESKTRKLSVFSDDRLLGIFLLPPSNRFALSTVVLENDDGTKPLNCQLERIVVYKHPCRYTLPEKAKRSYERIKFSSERLPKPVFAVTSAPVAPAPAAPIAVAAPAPAPAPAASRSETQAVRQVKPVKLIRQQAENKKRTLTVRLEACQKRLALISAQPDIPFKQEMLNFVAQQINELQKQQQIRQQIQLAKRKNYSTVATKNFTDALTRYYAKRKKHNGHTYQDTKEAKQLEKMWAAPDVDPNIHILADGKKIFIGDLFFCDIFPSSRDFPKIAVRKNMDVNLSFLFHPEKDFGSRYRRSIPIELFLHGLELVDGSDSGQPLIFKIFRQKKHSPFSTIGSTVLDGDINRFLLLAPAIDVINPGNGKTLMHLAAEHNKIELAKRLYYAGFTLFKKRDNQGKSPWDTALACGSRDVAGFLKTLGQDTPESADNMAQVDLYAALSDKDPEKLRRVIRSGKADLYKKNCNGLNAIEYAAALNSLPLLECLRDLGADFSTANSNARPLRSYDTGITHPLQIAVMNGNIPVLTFLLQQGISSNREFPHVMYGAGSLAEIIVYYQRVNHPRFRNVDPLRIIQTLKAYDKTWDINQCVRGKTVLSEACTRLFRNRNRQQQLTLIRYLLANGADINANKRNSRPSYRWNSNWPQRVHDPEIRRLLNLPNAGRPNQNYRRPNSTRMLPSRTRYNR